MEEVCLCVFMIFLSSTLLCHENKKDIGFESTPFSTTVGFSVFVIVTCDLRFHAQWCSGEAGGPRILRRHCLSPALFSHGNVCFVRVIHFLRRGIKVC
jgi:hypothetical protein